MLQLIDVRKSFAGVEVLKGIELQVRAGEFVAILGANGSGKSTALRCVVGLLEADDGTIRVADVALDPSHRERTSEARRKVAMVFQQIHLVRRRSVLDNVCCGALGRLRWWRSLSPALFPRDVRLEAMRCLDRVGLAERAGERAGRLSGGQQQRVAIARALCQRATVVLADEPVSALDPAAADNVVGLLRDLAQEGYAVVAVLHQPELALRYADRVVGLLGGRVVIDKAPRYVRDDEIDRLYAPDRAAALEEL
ncbi:phosphonate ABC transporter ATP-binding protein [uncultured Jatrophihabitans sp.]|uniref:phosphonate ABC transporter ATP-binding protein n=1 Tax=uncultured Jatrophihabitans sp. TaxID=1610747 RepID=UPI0035C94AA8